MQPSGNLGPPDLPDLGSELVELFLQNQKKYIFFLYTQDTFLYQHIKPVSVENSDYESEATSVNAKVTPQLSLSLYNTP